MSGTPPRAGTPGAGEPRGAPGAHHLGQVGVSECSVSHSLETVHHGVMLPPCNIQSPRIYGATNDCACVCVWLTCMAMAAEQSP